MFRIALSLAVLAPGALMAQVAGSASARTDTKVEARAGDGAGASAQTSASIDAELKTARERDLPERPIRHRVAEGRAKGASEVQLAAAARRVRLHMEAAHEAMVAAGRRDPSDAEVERGAYAIERGYTKAQIEAVAKSAPSDRSLVVAFDVLARLSARGVPVANALTQVRTRLEARATDASIETLVRTNSSAGVKPGAANAAAGGTVTGAVKGVIKP